MGRAPPARRAGGRLGPSPSPSPSPLTFHPHPHPNPNPNPVSAQVVVAWDHGQRSEALMWRGVCHAFAGPRRSADDVIASDALPSLLRSAGCGRVYVVTSDRELLWRCEAAASAAASPKGTLRFLGTSKLTLTLTLTLTLALTLLLSLTLTLTPTLARHVQARLTPHGRPRR